MPRYTEEQAGEAVAASHCYAEALRKLGLRPVGGNHRTFRKFVDEIWRIPTEHFGPERVRLRSARHQRPIPLSDVLADGQGEAWRGMRMSLILDHVVSRPSYEQLMDDLKSMSTVAVGRKYGVSDNAVRKWIRWYEYRQQAA